MGDYNELTLEPDNGPTTWTEQPTQTRAPRKTYIVIKTRKQVTIRTDIDGLFEATYHYQRTERGWRSALRKCDQLRAAGYQLIEG